MDNAETCEDDVDTRCIGIAISSEQKCAAINVNIISSWHRGHRHFTSPQYQNFQVRQSHLQDIRVSRQNGSHNHLVGISQGSEQEGIRLLERLHALRHHKGAESGPSRRCASSPGAGEERHG